MSGGDWKQLFKGVETGDIELVKFYIRLGININYQHPEYMTSPLIESVRLGHLEIAKLLLENGAEPHQREGFGTKTAFTIAKEEGHQAMIELLEQYR